MRKQPLLLHPEIVFDLLVHLGRLECLLLDWIRDHPDIKHTFVSMSECTGMIVSQDTDEFLYTQLIEMQEIDAP